MKKTIEKHLVELSPWLLVGGLAIATFQGILSHDQIKKYNILKEREKKINQEYKKRKQERKTYVYNILFDYVNDELAFYPKSGDTYLKYIGEDLKNYPELRKFKNANKFHRTDDLVSFYAEFNMEEKEDKRFHDYRGLNYGKIAFRPIWDRNKLKSAIKNNNLMKPQRK